MLVINIINLSNTPNMSAEQIKKIVSLMTPDMNYIRPIEAKNSLKNKDDFFDLLKYWFEKSNSDTIGDLKILPKNYPLINIQIGASTYYINADSKKAGVEKFLEHKENQWKIIMNERGKRNRVTNKTDEEAIPHFYMYKKI